MTTLSPPVNIGGRPTALTQPVLDIIAKAIREGMYITRACNKAGISRETYYDWLERGTKGEEPYLTFLTACQKAEAEHQEEKLHEIALAGQTGPSYWMAAAWQLERRYKSEYALRPEGLEGGNIQINVVLESPPGQQLPTPRMIESIAAPPAPEPSSDTPSNIT